MSYLIGVDTGGTFTDFALFDTEDQSFALHKYPSTPQDPSQGLINGLKELLTDKAVDPSDVSALIHGTTVGTNAVIVGALEDIGMITTAGFRDILELGRQRRPHLYNLDIEKPAPLAPRRLRLEVKERIDIHGRVQTPMDETDLEHVVNVLKVSGVSAVAVCFLHAYQNPAHERRARAFLRRLFPRALVTISSDVLREFREYERFSTTALNAALLPVMRGYLDRLGRRVRSLGVPATPRIFASYGSTVSLRRAKDTPVATLVSGPSAGVVGAAAVASAGGFSNLITLDMGGTSTDVCLVRDGAPLISRERQVTGRPIVAPSVDVHSVGTGGGSILWIDEGGFLHVGPDSAGAYPGPACYDTGGEEPTVTDANVVAGRLSPTRPLGENLKIFPDLAGQAIDQRVAGPLAVSTDQALAGTFMVLASNLVRAVRVVSVERGHDPRAFTLLGFGGAGPMHVTQLAQELGIPTVLVPEAPGVLCALGLLMADVRAEFSQSRLFTVVDGEVKAGRSTGRAVERVFKDLERRAARWLKAEGVDAAATTVNRVIEARYQGQGHEIPIAAGDVPPGPGYLQRLVEEFHRLHHERYGYARTQDPVQFVHFRLQVSAPGPRPRLRTSAAGDGNPARALVGTRAVYMGEVEGFVKCPVYWRPRLEPEDRFEGPAVVEQMDSTTVLLPGQDVRVDEYRNLIISVRVSGNSRQLPTP